MRKLSLVSIVLIILLAAFLRLYKVESLPPALNWDEVSIGYNAYSVLKTGHDEWGNFLPLSFKAFGDYKLPVYVYSSMPFIKVLGLNELGVRLPSALYGIAIVLLIFLIIKELTGKIGLSLFGMFLAAVLPWLIIFSRSALEANMALFLTIAALYFFLLGLRKKYWIIISSVLISLSIFTYNSSRVVILPFLFLTVILFKRELSGRKKEMMVAAAILFVLTAIALKQAFYVDSEARYRWTTILDEGAISAINQSRGLSKLPPTLAALRHNKATYLLTESSKNYIAHFDPNFLFLNGGKNFQFSVPGSGLLYITMLPLIFMGLMQVVSERKRWQLFVLGWLIIAPLPGAITRDAPHALRSIFLIVPFLILSVQGIDFLGKFLRPKLLNMVAILLISVLGFNANSFWQNYSGDYAEKYSWSWQYGYKQAIDYIQNNSAGYSKVIITKKYGEPHEFLLFYSGYDPLSYREDPYLKRYERSSWFWVDGFNKYEFINDWEIKSRMENQRNLLLVTSPDNYPQGFKLLDTIYFLNKERAFDIVAID